MLQTTITPWGGGGASHTLKTFALDERVEIDNLYYYGESLLKTFSCEEELYCFRDQGLCRLILQPFLKVQSLYLITA
jgi:hypothetical protein